MASSGDENGKTGQAESKHKVNQENSEHGFTLANLKAFLFDSAFNVITWVCIGACFLSASIFFSKDNMRGVYWSGVFLAAFIVLMLGLLGDRWFFQGTKKTTKPNERRPYVFLNVIGLKPLVAGQPVSMVAEFKNSGPTQAVVTLSDGTVSVRQLGDARPLAYKPTDKKLHFTIEPQAPKTAVIGWDKIFSAEEIKSLNEGTSKLYFFARGEYSGEGGEKYPLDFRFVYDSEPPLYLIECPEDVKIQ